MRDAGDYYDRKEQGRRAAAKALQEARERGADWREIARLTEALERAAYTGD